MARRSRACECGCGEELQPQRKARRFLNDTHRKRHERNGGPRPRQRAQEGLQRASRSTAVAERVAPMTMSA